MRWMLKGGAKLNKIKLHYYGKNNRGIIATEDIQKDEVLLFVPIK